MNNHKLFTLISGITAEELQYLKQITEGYNDNQLQTFASIYNGKRRAPDMILIGGVIGLVGIAGVQRFMVNQIGMGILFLLTGGLCLIGTIVDLVNYKTLAIEYNQRMAIEAKQITDSMNS